MQPLNPQSGSSAGSPSSSLSFQSGCSPSLSNDTPASTASDNCHYSQLGDVVDSTGDQGSRPTERTALGNSATSALDNVTSDTGDQELRPRSTWEATQL